MKILSRKSLVVFLVAVLGVFALVGCSAPAAEAPAAEELRQKHRLQRSLRLKSLRQSLKDRSSSTVPEPFIP